MAHPISEHLEIESEDDLTRVVFGILDMIGEDLFASVLSKAGISLSEEVTCTFHSKIHPGAERTPDVILETGETTIMVEVKRDRTLDLNQLEDELQDLEQHGKSNSTLLLVSDHDERPPELARNGLGEIKWLGWRDIAIQISAHETENLTRTQLKLLDVLRTKLEEEGYVPFTGMDAELLEDVSNVWGVLKRYYNQINMFSRDLQGRIERDGLRAKNLWRDGISQDFHRFPSDWRFITDHLWIAYGERGDEIREKRGRYAFIAFCSDEGSIPSVRVGFTFSPGNSQEDQLILADNADEIIDFLEGSEYSLIGTGWGFRERESISPDQRRSVITDQESLSGFDRVQIVAEYETEALTDAYITDTVAGDLTRIHGFVTNQLRTG